jgi:hypothetical protein
MSLNEVKKQQKLAGLKILLAEDDEINRIVVKKILENNGVEVVCAADGYVAVETFEKCDDIDLILMDIQLPGMDGIQTTAKIREIQNKKNKNVPVVALTAYAMNGNREYFLSMGLDDYSTKPINIEQLIKIILKHIVN